MPVGTQGTVKSLTPEDLRELGAEVILANTYHLYLRPGHERIRRLVGLHRFMHWEYPILTDSGGYQVFSLGELRNVLGEGVSFRSHPDGSSHFLTPELVVEIQEALGSVIAMCLNECTPHPVTHEEARRSLELTLDRARPLPPGSPKRGSRPCSGSCRAVFFKDLRRESAETLLEIGFDGYALGGLSVGEPPENRLEVIESTFPLNCWLTGPAT